MLGPLRQDEPIAFPLRPTDPVSEKIDKKDSSIIGNRRARQLAGRERTLLAPGIVIQRPSGGAGSGLRTCLCDFPNSGELQMEFLAYAPRELADSTDFRREGAAFRMIDQRLPSEYLFGQPARQHPLAIQHHLGHKESGAACLSSVGDGALGFWAALAEVYPETREQRC